MSNEPVTGVVAAVRLVDVAREVTQEPLEQNRVAREGDWHRVVVHVEAGQLVEVLVHRVGEIDQQVAAPVDGKRHPFAMRVPCRRDRTVDLVGAGQVEHGRSVRLSPGRYERGFRPTNR